MSETSAPQPKRPAPSRVVVQSTARRDALIAIAIGAVVLALVLYGISSVGQMPGRPSTNLLSGTIVAKHNAGEREEEITMGKKGLSAHEIDSGYSFDVKTADGRVYEVPIPKVQYSEHEVGSVYKFIRPESEQR